MPSSTCLSIFRTTTRSNNYVPMLGDLHPACFVQWYFDRAASAETNMGLCTHTASRIRNCATGRLRSLSAQSSTMMRSRSSNARARRLSITVGPTLLRCCHAHRNVHRIHFLERATAHSTLRTPWLKIKLCPRQSSSSRTRILILCL